MQADDRWIGQVLRHLKFKGDMAAAGKETVEQDIIAPIETANVFRSAFPGYENAVFIDLETTGLLPKEDMITQLSAVNIMLPERRIRTFNAYILPDNGMKIPDQIAELTGISDALLKLAGQSEGDVLASFGDWLIGDSFVFAGHNVQFDLCFLMEALNRHPDQCSRTKAVIEQADYFDTLTVYKDRRPSPHNLQAALKEYGSTFESHHHALEDAGGAFALTYYMGCEKKDLRSYINRVGINPKYGLVGFEIGRIKYYQQEGVLAADKTCLVKGKSL